MADILDVFKKKTELLCKGLYLDKNLIEHYQRQGIYIYPGRKGGAGPLGGRYFLFEDRTLVNIALWEDHARTNLTLGEKDGDYLKILDSKTNKVFSKLKLVQNPKYYDSSFKTSDGIPMKKIALVHGVDCLASTIYQKCVYWSCGLPCKFCGIELSLYSGDTILEKNARQMCEVITVAKKEGRCSHMTLTSGTDESIDKGAERYIEILKGIKKNFPDLPIHVQIEPLQEINYIHRLKKAGADTIGIHLEVVNEDLRKKITPGKAKIPFNLFEENWTVAIDIFGKNQVDTYILTGFGESKRSFIDGVRKIVSIGVIPFITPVRSIPGKKTMPFTHPDQLIDLELEVAEIMKEYDVNPLENKAGCVRCGGCSSIKEAYKVIMQN